LFARSVARDLRFWFFLNALKGYAKLSYHADNSLPPAKSGIPMLWA